MGIISIKDGSGCLSLARQMARDTRVARCGAMWGAPMLRPMTVVRRVGALARGVSTGAVTALTAAHGWSGGHWPSAGQITALLAVCSGLGPGRFAGPSFTLPAMQSCPGTQVFLSTPVMPSPGRVALEDPLLRHT